MSFLSALESDGKKILGAIETGLHFAIEASPVIGEEVALFNPAIGAMISMVGTKCIQAEAMITQAKAGAQRKAYVMAGLSDALTFGYAVAGKQVPADAMAGISNAVDAFVALMNGVQQSTAAKA